MKIRTLLIVTTVFGIAAGTGGKLAYDAFQEREPQRISETPAPYIGCDACSARKAEMTRMSKENKARRALLEEQENHNAE